MLDKLKANFWMLAVAVVTTLLLLQSWRLHTSQLETAAVQVTLSTERSAWSEERTKAATKLATLQGKLRTAEGVLEKQASDNRKATNDKVRDLTVRNDSLLERVRNAERATAASDMSGTITVAGNGQVAGGSAGKELLGWLGEEDVREAQRADVIRLHLAACYADYDRAKAALEALNQGPN